VKHIQRIYAQSTASSSVRIAALRRRKNRVTSISKNMAPCFLLDGMLGSLARWLRIGGYDTKYRKNAPDDDLIEEALRDNRILLTRDEVLTIRARKRGVKSIYVKADSDEETLQQLRSELNLVFDPTMARCPKCNHKVEKASKEHVEHSVPAGTYRVVDEFWVCPRCGSVYWRGSHWPRIVDNPAAI
jgi:uncharacterized protein with PIN domain